MTRFSSLLLASSALPSFTDGRGLRARLRLPTMPLPNAEKILENLSFQTRSKPSSASNRVLDLEPHDFSFSKVGDDISGEDYYGFSGTSLSLSANGQYIAVGAMGARDSRGSVRTFEYDDESKTWLPHGQTLEGEGGGDGAGTSVSLSNDGLTLAIGAPHHNQYYGHTKVYTFNLNSASWTQLGQDLDGAAIDGAAGSSVALSGNGNRVAIGSPDESKLKGSVSVFEYISDTWTRLGSKILGNGYYSTLGNSVALSDNGGRVVVGSKNDKEGVEKFVGAVSVFEYTDEDWVQLGSDLSGEAYMDHFGDSVDISGDGDRIVVGIPNKEGGALNNVGSAEVFQYDADTDAWDRLGNPMMGEIEMEQMGTSVSMSKDGNRIVVGSAHSDENGQNSGKTWVFQYDTSSNEWIQLGTNIFGDEYDRAGQAVTMSANGKRFAIGAPFDNFYYGQTKVYEIGRTDGCADSQRLLSIEVTTDANGDTDNYFVVKKYDEDTEKFSRTVWREKNLQSSTTETFERCLPLNKCYQFIMLDRAEDGIEDGTFKVTWDGTLVKHFKRFNDGAKKKKSPAFGGACPN